MLDEKALRRADFLPGVPIRLADGQHWTFPVPRVSLALRQEEVSGENGSQYGPGYGATVAAILEAGDEPEHLQAELALAIFLLGRNYDLSPAAFLETLNFARGDPTLVAMQHAFHEVALEHVRCFQVVSAR